MWTLIPVNFGFFIIMKQYYVYKLVDPITKQYYYGSRGFDGNPENDSYMGSMKTWKPEDKSRLIKTIIKSNFTDLPEAIEFESNIISNEIDNPLNENYYIPNKGFHTDGLNWKLSEVSKENISKSRIKNETAKGENNPMFGKTHTDEAKKKMSNSAMGRIRTEESKIKQTNSRKGIKFTEEHKKSLRESHIGKVHTEESKKLISENNALYWKGKSRSEETKKKISESNKGRIGCWKGKKLSEEHKKKIGDARRGKKYK